MAKSGEDILQGPLREALGREIEKFLKLSKNQGDPLDNRQCESLVSLGKLLLSIERNQGAETENLTRELSQLSDEQIRERASEILNSAQKVYNAGDHDPKHG